MPRRSDVVVGFHEILVIFHCLRRCVLRIPRGLDGEERDII